MTKKVKGKASELYIAIDCHDDSNVYVFTGDQLDDMNSLMDDISSVLGRNADDVTIYQCVNPQALEKEYKLVPA